MTSFPATRIVAGMLVGLSLGCVTTQQEQTLTTIALENTVHFVGAGGKERIMPAGRFEVAPVAPDALQLTPLGREMLHSPSILAAEGITLPLQSDAAAAIAMPYENGQYSIVWIGPDGSGLEAMGSVNGVQPRNICDAACTKQRKEQLEQELNNVLKTRHDTARNSIGHIR